MGGSGPELCIAQGALRGSTERGIDVFRGIPFAAPPVGPLRFRRPAPPEPWHGTRDATAFRNAPVQPPPPPGVPVRFYLGADTSEDCLYLNIWRPRTPGPHPVLVYIHGGGNIAGAASQAADCTASARAGIVCVTIAYRLGAFGFLELGRLLGPDYHGSGMNGLRDQIAALHWIQANIGAFGGDPARVTIAGASAGAKNVITLMASPLAHGLYSSAIVESGGETLHDFGSAHVVADLLAARMRTRGLEPGALATLPAADLNALQIELVTAYDRPFPFRSIVGTDILPDEPLTLLRSDPRRHRLLIGTNRDEAIMFIDPASAARPIAQHDLANVDVAEVRPVAAAYDRLFASLDPLHRRVRLVSAEEYVVSSVRLADVVRARGDVWMYRFAQPAPSGPFAGWAVHASAGMYAWKIEDQPLMAATFGQVDAAGRRLADDMSARWAAFILGKAPDIPGAPHWPRFDGHAVLLFADFTSQAGTLDQDEIALWNGIRLGRPGPGRCP